MGVILEEMLYHVNGADEVIGKISRNEAHLEELLHRTGIVFLMNRLNQVYLTKRTSQKKTFPSCYDSSVSFHVRYGETYGESAKRETEEEIGIKAFLKYIGKFQHRDPPEYQFVSVYLCVSDDEPVIDHKEFSEGKFYSMNEAEKIIRSEKITPWLRDGWKMLINYLN